MHESAQPRRECTRSVLFQSSPAKAALDLNEARKAHRSRVKSIENVQFQRFNKERIYRDIYELECSWNDFQYQKQREVLVLGTGAERSLTKHVATVDHERSPDPVGQQQRTLQSATQSDKKGPHRTKISLISDSKKQLICQFERPAGQLQTSHKSSLKQLHKNANPPAAVPAKKSSEYIQRVFNNCLASKTQEATPKLRCKPTRQQTTATIRKQKQPMKISSPSPRHKYSQHQCAEPPATFTGKSRKAPSNFFHMRQTTESSRVARATVRMNCSNMEIESILFQQLQSRQAAD